VRFLADNDEADELDLALDAELADAMTPGTFVSGEAASVAPLPGKLDRAMYLPPNSASNAAFLETLRSTVLEQRDDLRGAPVGLELASATPRRWLAPGGTIAVRRLPTSFGPVSFSLAATERTVRATVEPPPHTPRSLVLALRLPGHERIGSVELDGHRYRKVDAASGMIDLSGIVGEARLVIVLTSASREARVNAEASGRSGA
jgi:hypothetical protein